jgi:ribonuclease HII
MNTRARRTSTITIDFERAAHERGYRFVAGLDEVGRGALAGPVVAAAVILDSSKPLPEGLNDSKQLTLKARERIAAEVRESAIAFSIGAVEAAEIDRINILQATKRAMLHALAALQTPADYLLIDALELSGVAVPQQAIIGGDAVSASIAAASVIAKVYRDDLMREYDATHPGYGFAQHVGYGTRAHLAALKEQGACPLHRHSFRPVALVAGVAKW